MRDVTVRGGGGGGGWRVTSCTYEGPFDSRGGMGGKGRIKVQTKAPPTVQGTLDGDTAFGALP